VRLAVPKAYIVLADGWAASAATAEAIFAYAKEHMPPYARIRRLEFADLPKTISGKIRRVELRAAELTKHADPTAVPPGEFSG
jgi:acetyl-CoA synthetase